MEEQRAREALVLVQKKHTLIKWESERDRARTIQSLGVSRSIGPWSEGQDDFSFGSCSSSLAFDGDGAISASSRIVHEEDEEKSEASWTAVAKEKERAWWSVDPEGEAEELEVKGPGSVTDSCSVDGEMRQQDPRWKAAKEEKEKLKVADMEVDEESCQEEIAEIQSPKRKVIRVESKETRYYVCEVLEISQEEAEALAFVPSEPRGAIYLCDNRCSEKAVRYWQFASVVVEEGGEAHTVNFVSAVLHCTGGAARQAKVEFVALERWKRKLTVVECGKSMETSNLFVVCGSISLTKKRSQRMLRAKGKKAHNVTGSRSHRLRRS